MVVGVRIQAEARSEEVARKPGKNKEVMKKKGYGKKKKSAILDKKALVLCEWGPDCVAFPLKFLDTIVL